MRCTIVVSSSPTNVPIIISCQIRKFVQLSVNLRLAVLYTGASSKEVSRGPLSSGYNSQYKPRPLHPIQVKPSLTHWSCEWSRHVKSWSGQSIVSLLFFMAIVLTKFLFSFHCLSILCASWNTNRGVICSVLQHKCFTFLLDLLCTMVHEIQLQLLLLNSKPAVCYLICVMLYLHDNNSLCLWSWLFISRV